MVAEGPKEPNEPKRLDLVFNKRRSASHSITREAGAQGHNGLRSSPVEKRSEGPINEK
jgi:hypothetical protein